MNVVTRLILVLFFLAGLPGQTPLAAAQNQETGTIQCSTPQTDLFPRVHFYMNAYDNEGAFVSNLLPRDVQILENGQALNADEIKKIPNGLQVILAVNTSPQLGVPVNGVNEFQRVQAALEQWARSQDPSRADDYSLATPTGLHLIRSTRAEELTQAIAGYQPDLTQNPPPLNSLAEALDMATDPLSDPLMKRAILYITPPLPDASSASLPDLADRAVQIGVRVHVWLLSPVSGNGVAGEAALRGLAETSGGQYFRVAPGEPLPEIEPLLEPLRQTYQVFYTSGIQTSGPQAVSVQIARGLFRLESEPMPFELTVSPPNPIFLSPPAAIQRAWRMADKGLEPVLEPESVHLQILVEFPDHHPRALHATRLYVNESVIAENLAEPFDTFIWPVGELTTSGRHVLRAEVVDALGLTGTSIDIPIDVVIEQPAQNSVVQKVSGRGMVAVGAVAISGIALGLVLFLTNTQRRLSWKRQLAERRRMKDPVTQPVVVAPVQPKKDRSTGKKERQPASPRPGWPLRGWNPNHPETPGARLICLDDAEQPVTGGAIALTRQEITFGSDPRRATQVLNSATVDGLHAHLYRSEDGVYYLADHNSVAGSWINYAPVNESGARLEHGDLIHIGKVMFRFELSDPDRLQPPEIKVTALD